MKLFKDVTVTAHPKVALPDIHSSIHLKIAQFNSEQHFCCDLLKQMGKEVCAIVS